MLKNIKLGALLIAFLAWYVAPALPLVVISSIPNFFLGDPATREGVPIWQSGALLLLAWIMALAPVGSGYLAAKLAQQQPLLHGLVIGMISGLIAVLWIGAPWLFELALAALVTCCGFFGGWLWRYRHPQPPASGPRS